MKAILYGMLIILIFPLIIYSGGWVAIKEPLFLLFNHSVSSGIAKECDVYTFRASSGSKNDRFKNTRYIDLPYLVAESTGREKAYGSTLPIFGEQWCEKQIGREVTIIKSTTDHSRHRILEMGLWLPLIHILNIILCTFIGMYHTRYILFFIGGYGFFVTASYIITVAM